MKKQMKAAKNTNLGFMEPMMPSNGRKPSKDKKAKKPGFKKVY